MTKIELPAPTGLKDRPRPGRPVTYGHDDRLRIIKTICEEPPAPASRWTMDAVSQTLADEVGISASQVWRICRGLDLKPWQVRSWMTSHDPDFWAKAADVCGLYLSPLAFRRDRVTRPSLLEHDTTGHVRALVRNADIPVGTRLVERNLEFLSR